jgi:hypothetical protein
LIIAGYSVGEVAAWSVAFYFNAQSHLIVQLIILGNRSAIQDSAFRLLC